MDNDEDKLAKVPLTCHLYLDSGDGSQTKLQFCFQRPLMSLSQPPNRVDHIHELYAPPVLDLLEVCVPRFLVPSKFATDSDPVKDENFNVDQTNPVIGSLLAVVEQKLRRALAGEVSPGNGEFVESVRSYTQWEWCFVLSQAANALPSADPRKVLELVLSMPPPHFHDAFLSTIVKSFVDAHLIKHKEQVLEVIYEVAVRSSLGGLKDDVLFDSALSRYLATNQGIWSPQAEALVREEFLLARAKIGFDARLR